MREQCARLGFTQVTGGQPPSLLDPETTNSCRKANTSQMWNCISDQLVTFIETIHIMGTKLTRVKIRQRARNLRRKATLTVPLNAESTL